MHDRDARSGAQQAGADLHEAAGIAGRDELGPGRKYSGPAIITEYSATTAIPPGRRFHIDGAANLIVNIR